MSAILGVFSTDGRLPGDAAIRKMMAVMRTRGADREEVWRGEGAVLAVSRYAWELRRGFAGSAMVLADGDLVIVADASLYYRDDLRHRLARLGIDPRGDTPSHLVLAAYRAWGDGCARHLEGDFAFIIWNTHTRRLCAARDYSGKRPLFVATLPGCVVLASTVNGVLAYPETPGELNLASIAATASGLFATVDETCYSAIRAVPAGWTLADRETGSLELVRHWTVPEVTPTSELGFEDAADALRELLTRAVIERLDPDDSTAMWLSGGWDSPAVFGIAEHARQHRGEWKAIRPVSISYPPGDPGREDELILQIASLWGAPVHWLSIGDIPLLDHPADRAARRDEPFAHAFEMWLRALARGARASGAHVALDGMGGDQLFQVSEIYLADLLRSLRLVQLAREWRQKGMTGTGFRNFFRWTIQPLLSSRMHALATFLRRGRPLMGHLERRPPPWIDPTFERQHRLAERERAHTPQHRRGSCASHETEWYLSHPYFPMVFASASGLALEEGVEARSPLYDDRVIRFAATRPREERSSGAETKRLLRRAVAGLLPEEILRPRTQRTGSTGAYFDRSLRAALPTLVETTMKSPIVQEIGIVDAECFRRSCADYVQGSAPDLGVSLFFTLQVELWLRARLRPIEALSSPSGEASVAMVR